MLYVLFDRWNNVEFICYFHHSVFHLMGAFERDQWIVVELEAKLSIILILYSKAYFSTFRSIGLLHI